MASSETKTRPDPDALLALAGREGRGTLTIFLGAAPGVGKTYAMLARARRLKADGVDILVGLVETHGRSETSALLEGLEILPRRSFLHNGRAMEEFDLDAALARRPRIIIVDELAHTNAPDSRHPKRYQDIEELLGAGLHVWTALNIQHLESLADVVAQITGTPVRERVPDTVLKKADEVLLVDLPPGELIERLKQGKVYLPGNAQRAADSFFRLGNLTALRELALRRTADRVDDQMVDYLRQNAIEGPWQTAERLIVCIGADTLSEKIVRTASGLASGLNAPWIVVSVERADREPPAGPAAQRLDETFRLAEQLGAETRRITGSNFVEEILKLARREQATQIVIGGRPLPPLRRLFRQSLPDALLERASGIGIHIVTARADAEIAPRPPLVRPFWRPSWRQAGQAVFAAVMPVCAATLVGLGITRFIHLPNISLVYLLAVLVAAMRASYLAAITAALLSGLTYNFFFIVPIGSLSIAEPHEVFALAIFLAAAILAGGLAARIREQATIARERAATTQALYDMARKLAGTAKADDVMWVAVTQLHATLKRDVAFLVPDLSQGDLGIGALWPPDTELGVADLAAARWAFDKKEVAGSGTGTLPNAGFQFRPLTSPQGVIGVCGFRQVQRALDSRDERSLGAILDQTAIAMDRARLARESVAHAARLESERLRAALLSSISHDLRTPLASITGAVTTLRQYGAQMGEESRGDLLASIEEESARLSRFVANLLDMTRIEAGTIDARRDWVEVSDVVRLSVERARRYYPGRPIATHVALDLPLVRGDSVLLGQALFNLIDNALKYGEGEPVTVYARMEGDEVVISVVDLGKGIAPDDLERIFEKFFRSGPHDGRAPGTGLGLSIAKGFVDAMGGTIKAESPAQQRRGTRVAMRFPAARPEMATGDEP